MKDTRVSVRGRVWNLRQVSQDQMQHAEEEPRGECDHPNQTGKEIRVLEGMPSKEELEVIIHELLHASLWDLDEEAISETARDVAAVLHKLGWREVRL